MAPDTAPKKTPGPKTGRPRMAARKAAQTVAGEGADVTEAGDVAAAVGPVLKKKDLVEQIVVVTKAKPKDVKLIVDAMLTLVGEALAKGEGLNLPPLGRAKITRQKDLKLGEMITLRLHRGGGAGKSKTEPAEALAEADE